MLFGCTAFVRSITHRIVQLGGNNCFFAAQPQLLEGAAGDLFAQPAGVHIGGIEEINSCFDRLFEEWERLLFVQYPRPSLGRAVAHTA